MITQLELNGFKSFLSNEIELGPLTLLTGINSSGKSSIIQAIRLLEKISQDQDPMLSGHGTLQEFINPFVNNVEVLAKIDHEAEISLSQARGEFNSFVTVNQLIEQEKTFPGITYIAADRYGPETFLPIFPGQNYELGSRGENLFKVIAQHGASGVDTVLPEMLKHENSQGETFAFNLEAWLGVISPNPRFDSLMQEFSETSFATFNNYRAKNVGFGLSYILPVLTALLVNTAFEDTLVMIENPEAHLHPKGQTEIARLVARCVEAGVQVIIETHSDHIFNGIRVQAKESESNFHEKVKTYWFELDEEDNTVVEEVNIDSNGRIDNSPMGLFDQFKIKFKGFHRLYKSSCIYL
ncbi:MAG: DUF3696 domain-containing protein, partial [Bacteroidota bacterium]